MSHLCFVDDMVFFAEAGMDQINTIMQCVDQVCSASGQKVSMAKTHIFFLQKRG